MHTASLEDRRGKVIFFRRKTAREEVLEFKRGLFRSMPDQVLLREAKQKTGNERNWWSRSVSKREIGRTSCREVV